MSAGAARLLVLLAGLRLGGEHTCPSPGAVALALAAIEPGGAGEVASEETVTIDPGEGDAAIVRFHAASGAVVGERALPPGLACAERAQAAAVIIAARFVPRAGEPLTGAPPARAGDAGAVSAAPRSDPSYGAAPFRRTAELETALLATHAGTDFAPGVRVAVGLGLRPHSLARLALSYVAPARTPVAGSWAIWSRSTVACGYAARVAVSDGSASFLEVDAEAVLAALVIRSDGFQRTERHVLWDPGLALGVRLGRHGPGRLALWGGLSGVWWPRRHELYLRDVSETTALPRLELIAAFGASWVAK
jgi:hypothetical protein